ncbi:hypothetical protein P3T76_010746 [Phytophthora citrophthora]|uniref:Uncharacterized protein n=1 Tax=Phytophthora citrophthora TaxID=4793 RepID=A0AAD9GAV2_9STRA|nr:hypothetical protein P3T76_010746 [Phytophthora citrophthora]
MAFRSFLGQFADELEVPGLIAVDEENVFPPVGHPLERHESSRSEAGDEDDYQPNRLQFEMEKPCHDVN